MKLAKNAKIIGDWWFQKNISISKLPEIKEDDLSQSWKLTSIYVTIMITIKCDEHIDLTNFSKIHEGQVGRVAWFHMEWPFKDIIWVYMWQTVFIIFLLIYVNNQQKFSTRKRKNISLMYIFHYLFRWTLISLGMNLVHVSIERNENAFSIIWFSCVSKQEGWRELTSEFWII